MTISIASILFTQSAVIQGEMHTSVPVVVLDHEAETFWSLNPYTGESNLLYTHHTQLGQILDFEVDSQRNVIYLLEGGGCCGGMVAGESQILEIDVDAGTARSVFSSRNVFEIDRIPDDNFLLVSHYDTKLESISAAARDGLLERCTLDLRTQICADKYGISGYDSIGWLRDDQFIGNVRNSALQGASFLVNSADSSRIELPAYAPYWTRIPSTDEILTTDGGAGKFTRINVDTLNTESYMIDGVYDPSVQFYPVSFSPDGASLLFLYGYTYEVAAFPTGEVIATLENAYDPQWVDASNLIYSHFEVVGRYPGELRRYNMSSGDRVRLMEIDRRIQFVVIE